MKPLVRWSDDTNNPHVGEGNRHIKQITGSWTAVFIIAAALDLITALLAIAVLRPLRARRITAG